MWMWIWKWWQQRIFYWCHSRSHAHSLIFLLSYLIDILYLLLIHYRMKFISDFGGSRMNAYTDISRFTLFSLPFSASPIWMIRHIMISNLLFNVHSIVVDLIRNFLDRSYFEMKDYLFFFGPNSHYYLLSCVCIAIKNENHWIRWNVPQSLSIQINRIYSYCDSNSKFNWTFYVYVCVFSPSLAFILCALLILHNLTFYFRINATDTHIVLKSSYAHNGCIKGHWLLRIKYRYLFR